MESVEQRSAQAGRRAVLCAPGQSCRVLRTEGARHVPHGLAVDPDVDAIAV